MSSNKAILTYFAGRGRAEIIRLTMAATGVQWEQKDLLEVEDFENLKKAGKLVFGQVPLVEINGLNLVQSNAAARYFAKQGDLMGDSLVDQTHIDILYEGTRDFLSSFMSYGFQGWDSVLENAKSKALPKYLPAFETALKKNGSNGFLVGNKLSICDLGLLEVILTVDELLGMDQLKDYADIKKFYQNVKSIDNIAKYLNSSQRPKKNDEAYVQTVRKVLSF